MAKHKYTIQDIADRMGLSVRTVRRHIKKGDLPAVKVGRSYVITRTDLVEWLGSEERVDDIFGTST